MLEKGEKRLNNNWLSLVYFFAIKLKKMSKKSIILLIISYFSAIFILMGGGTGCGEFPLLEID